MKWNIYMIRKLVNLKDVQNIQVELNKEKLKDNIVNYILKQIWFQYLVLYVNKKIVIQEQVIIMKIRKKDYIVNYIL